MEPPGLRFGQRSVIVTGRWSLAHPPPNCVGEYCKVVQMPQIIKDFVLVQVQILMHQDVAKPGQRCKVTGKVDREHADLTHP